MTKDAREDAGEAKDLSFIEPSIREEDATKGLRQAEALVKRSSDHEKS